jgi:putative addiction module killer protein
MHITPKEAYLYRFQSGRCPFEEWLESMRDRVGRAKIRARIARARTGNLGKCDPVGGGVFELKIDFGPGYRVYFGEVGDAIIILLCGGDKSSQRKDIKAAQNYWADYWRHPHEAREKLS